MTQKKQRLTLDEALKIRERQCDEQRKDSTLWRLMKADKSLSFPERERMYQRACMLINTAYILSDMIDWCARDTDDLLKRFGAHVRNATQHDYKRMRRYVQQLQSITAGRFKTADRDDETARLIAGSSDFYYDVIRMLIDRLDRPKTALHLIHLIRQLPNVNNLFPELDKGRYRLNK